MSRVLCRLLVVAAVAAAVLACTARAACDAQCKTCELGVCVGCNSGYYLDGQTCTACPGEGCRDCGASGVCTSCMDGYTLTVSVDGNTNTASPVVNGTCKSTAELTCSDTRCKSCVMGRCVACEDGYYLDGQTCTACPVERCRQCFASGMCTSCMDGYKLTFSFDDNSGTASPILKRTCKPAA
ncbi:hypothetical protein NESM_000899400 [Novymonas esmeraldas]|uniref:EGF-like domain-containing protein n=1 Tax=Novymonas esmeraldas TaxID=1808958 RepID=A0AAW0F0G6_9TRYP